MNMKGVLQITILMLAATLLVLPVSGAFTVTGITPDQEVNNGSVFIYNLSGTGLPEDASVKLMLTDQPTITGQFVYTWDSYTRITCVFDLLGKKAGCWDVVVVNNTDGSEVVLPAGFTVKNPIPALTGIEPAVGINEGPVLITNLSGTGFMPYATVYLTNGITTIPGTNVTVITGSRIECEFDLDGAVPGAWDVVVSNDDDQSGIMEHGFQVTFPPPEVLAITPSNGKNDAIIGITNLAGANFLPGATVNLTKAEKDNITTISAPIVQAGKILCFFDLNGQPVGSWNVVVTNTVDGQEGVLADSFTIFYPQGPTVAGIIPDNGENDAQVTVLVTGTGFEDGASATLLMDSQPDIHGTNVTVINATTISCDLNITSAEIGTWDVRVENNDGQGDTRFAAFGIRNPAPILDAIDPDNGLTTESAKTIILSGAGFKTGPKVVFMRDDVANITATVVSVDPTEVNCTVDLTGAATGLWSVVLTNTDGQSAVLGDAFNLSYPSPEITAIDPLYGVTGQTVPVNITGNAFRTGATVNLTNGTTTIPGTNITFITGNRIECEFDLEGAVPDAWDVVVINNDGQSDVFIDAFNVYDLPPEVTVINPVSGSTGQEILVNITGSDFRGGATVNLTKAGENNITTIGDPIVQASKITCLFDLTGTAIGSWNVVVTNTDHQSGVLPEGFSIRYPAAPQVLDIDPSTGVNTGIATIINLSGTGFMPNASVHLTNGIISIPGTNVTVITGTRIECEFDLEGAVPDAWDVVVINDDGQSDILENGYQVTFPAPAILGISPSSSINTAAVPVTISGTSFLSPATVNLTNGPVTIQGTGVTVVNAAAITCTLPIAGSPAGDWNLTVTNPDGQYDIATTIFTIENPAPAVTSITPVKGSNDSSVFISALMGTGFLPNASVQLTRNGYAPITATDVTVESPTMITCTLDLTGRATGSWNVVVVNTDGKAGDKSGAFTITPPQSVPDFTVSPELGTAPLTVQFTDLSTNNPTQWRWDFNDGTVMTGNNLRNPVHTYNNPGVYTVELRVWNAAGQTLTTATRVITVVATPVASFTADPVSGSAPMLVRFTDTSDGTPERWLWKFGDGIYSTQKNPTHVYEKPGLYTVTLTVSNKAGSDTIMKANLVKVMSLPVASFTANRTSGTSPLAVKFTDTSTGSPTSWSWKFDSSGSTEQNPVFVFQNTGTYSVQLTVSNSAGTSTETKNGYIIVDDLMRAEFEFTTSNPDNTAPLSVAFTDRSTGKPFLWSWKFGDGFTSSEKNPIHTYTWPGTYNITLTITGLSGTDSITKSIQVKSLLKAEFVAEPTTGSAPLTVQLSDTSTGTPVSRNWIFIDPADPADLRVVVIEDGPANPVYTFNDPGLYTVLLQVKDASGEEDVAAKEGYIRVFPFP